MIQQLKNSSLKKMSLDPREFAYKSDLAAEYLREIIEADKYSLGETFRIITNVVPMRRCASNSSERVSELLFGEEIIIFETSDEWAWGQSQTDGYVGYVSKNSISNQLRQGTHEVSALRTFVFDEPNIKANVVACLSMTSRIKITDVKNSFSYIESLGWVFEKSICCIGNLELDAVSVAQRYTGTPYLWGGRSSIGIDCSALVQLSLSRVGVLAPRDTDQQAKSVGKFIGDDTTELQRGDLIYMKGHVAIATTPNTILHANAFHMSVEEEGIDKFLHRLSKHNIQISHVRRPLKLITNQ